MCGSREEVARSPRYNGLTQRCKRLKTALKGFMIPFICLSPIHRASSRAERIQERCE